MTRIARTLAGLVATAALVGGAASALTTDAVDTSGSTGSVTAGSDSSTTPVATATATPTASPSPAPNGDNDAFDWE